MIKRFIASTLIIATLCSCTSEVNLATSNPSALSLFHNQQYFFSLISFSISQEDIEKQAIIEQAKLDFQADINNQNLQSYQKPSGFSILLLAGSEGNRLLAGSEGNKFQTPQSLESLPLGQSTPAQLIVFDNQNDSQIFKGQFKTPEFQFTGQASIPDNNTAYLLAQNQEGSIETFKGTLSSNTQTETKTAVAEANEPVQAEVSPPEPAFSYEAGTFLERDDHFFAPHLEARGSFGVYRPEAVPAYPGMRVEHFEAGQIFEYPPSHFSEAGPMLMAQPVPVFATMRREGRSQGFERKVYSEGPPPPEGKRKIVKAMPYYTQLDNSAQRK